MNYIVNNTPIRHITASATMYHGRTPLMTFSGEDRIKSIEIQRVGEENKFFGFGICQKLNIHLIDENKEIQPTTDYYFRVALNGNYYPYFFITECHRDENTNELSITAYDMIYFANNRSVSDLTLTIPYTIKGFVQACGAFLADYIEFEVPDILNIEYPGAANFDGTEGLRDALNAAAEATGAVYYMKDVNENNVLVFKSIPALDTGEIGVNEYFTLKSGTNRRLTKLCSTTELGDNVHADNAQTGTTQYIRNNPFLELRTDIDVLLDNIFSVVENMTINQFEADWRGWPPLVDCGTRLTIALKDGGTIETHLFNDSIVYEGNLKQKTEWQYSPTNDCESAGNPTSLGDALKYTYARVDKVNREIELVASESSQNTDKIAQIQMTTDTIRQTVERVEKNTGEVIEELNGEIVELTKKVETQLTAEDISFQIKQELSNGTDSITTSTGFKFDETGLTISKTGTEMSTIITEDGMTVYKNDEAMLVANNQGVVAHNLHADTYLIIGTYSRFEDYQSNKGPRTGCFWIGG